MSRYVEADALIYSKTPDGDVVIYPEAIAEAPSIDIVMCKDCKHHDLNLYGGWCNYHLAEFEAYDFCSYGERSE